MSSVNLEFHGRHGCLLLTAPTVGPSPLPVLPTAASATSSADDGGSATAPRRGCPAGAPPASALRGSASAASGVRFLRCSSILHPRGSHSLRRWPPRRRKTPRNLQPLPRISRLRVLASSESL